MAYSFALKDNHVIIQNSSYVHTSKGQETFRTCQFAIPLMNRDIALSAMKKATSIKDLMLTERIELFREYGGFLHSGPKDPPAIVITDTENNTLYEQDFYYGNLVQDRHYKIVQLDENHQESRLEHSTRQARNGTTCTTYYNTETGAPTGMMRHEKLHEYNKLKTDIFFNGDTTYRKQSLLTWDPEKKKYNESFFDDQEYLCETWLKNGRQIGGRSCEYGDLTTLEFFLWQRTKDLKQVMDFVSSDFSKAKSYLRGCLNDKVLAKQIIKQHMQQKMS